MIHVETNTSKPPVDLKAALEHAGYDGPLHVQPVLPLDQQGIVVTCGLPLLERRLGKHVVDVLRCKRKYGTQRATHRSSWEPWVWATGPGNWLVSCVALDNIRRTGWHNWPRLNAALEWAVALHNDCRPWEPGRLLTRPSQWQDQ